MKNLTLLQRTCLLVIATIGYFAILSTPADAIPMPFKASMPVQEVLQKQANAGTYTSSYRAAHKLLNRGLQVEKTKPQQAAGLFNAASNVDKTFDKAAMYECRVQKNLGKYKQAIDACREAIIRLPNYAVYHIQLAEVLELANLRAEAIVNYEKAQALYIENQVPDQAAVAGANALRLRGV
jgi:tetratricopeptide (TPR) repeat protein